MFFCSSTKTKKYFYTALFANLNSPHAARTGNTIKITFLKELLFHYLSAGNTNFPYRFLFCVMSHSGKVLVSSYAPVFFCTLL